MKNNPFVKKLLFAGGVIITLVVMTILFLLISTVKAPVPQTENPKLSPQEKAKAYIISLNPAPAEQLTAGKTQTFIVTLDPSVDPHNVNATIWVSPPSDTTKRILALTTKIPKPQELEITTLQPIDPFRVYSLELTHNGTTILQQQYLSGSIQPTPVPQNNTQLSLFLPYETSNYLLEYNKELNLYIMHFRYNTDSQKDLTMQFNEAKQNANNYIQSKGIDPTSIVIKYSNK